MSATDKKYGKKIVKQVKAVKKECDNIYNDVYNSWNAANYNIFTGEYKPKKGYNVARWHEDELKAVKKNIDKIKPLIKKIKDSEYKQKCKDLWFAIKKYYQVLKSATGYIEDYEHDCNEAVDNIDNALDELTF